MITAYGLIQKYDKQNKGYLDQFDIEKMQMDIYKDMNLNYKPSKKD